MMGIEVCRMDIRRINDIQPFRDTENHCSREEEQGINKKSKDTDKSLP